MLDQYESSEAEAAHFGPSVRLGKLAREVDPRTLQLARYFVPLAKPPASLNRSHEVEAWPMYGNDTLGDCTCAAVGHFVEGVTAAAGTPVVPPDQAVLDLYWGTGKQDNGRMCLDVLKAMRGNGLDGKNKIAAFAEIDPKNHSLVKSAIQVFGGVYLGAGLPLAVQGKTSWTKPHSLEGNGAPGSWGGHCINGVDYTSESLTVVTWGTLLKASWGFLDAYCDEMYAIITPDFLTKAGTSPADAGGLNIAQLTSDLNGITG